MPAPTLYDGLVGYWKFDALDLDGFVPDGAGHLGRGVLTDASLVSGGLFGKALRTTTTGKMVVADDLSQRQSATQRISVNVWIDLDTGVASMRGEPVVVDKTGGLTAGFFLGVLPGGGNVISFRIHNAAGTPYTASYAEAATTGRIMVTGVYEGSTVRIYRNAVSQGTAAADGSLSFAHADLDDIGLNLDGTLDELSLWMAMLTSGDVTALYNAGAGLELVLPECTAGDVTAQDRDGGKHIEEPYAAEEPPISDYIPPVDFFDAVPTLVVAASWRSVPMLPYAASPYAVVDSPRRIFVDPHPNIVSIEIDANRHIVATGNAGPTDAASVTTWWQIEILPDMIFIVAERNAGALFDTNHNQTDSWVVPFGQNWKNLFVTFWLQANEDASQLWSSESVQLTNPLYDNSGSTPDPLPPGPPLGPQRGPTRGLPGPGVYRPRLIDKSRR